MKPSSRLSRLSARSSAMLLACLLTACGLTGPLYMPQVPAVEAADSDKAAPAANPDDTPTRPTAQ